ncbi:MAG: histidine phosphatase family protein [Oscillospiraceae bacterium]|nr:histidine phosphatase family protein [Oscillospiraceae bacterium]
MKLLIVRHGDPDYANDALTERGWREAELLAERMAKLEIAAFYVSPLGRARETAEATLRRLGRKGETLDWLREFAPRRFDPDCGRETVIWDWLPQTWTAEKAFYDREAWMHVPVMEDAGVPAEARWVYGGLDALLAAHGYEHEGDVFRVRRPNRDTVALFCHFGVECVMLGHLLGISPMPLWHGTCALTTSVTTLATEERRQGIASFRMSGFGDVSHLPAAGQEPSFSARFCETWDCAEERHD